MRNVYYNYGRAASSNIATSKAPSDVSIALDGMGARFLYERGSRSEKAALRLLQAAYDKIRVFFKLKRNDIVIYQYPYLGDAFSLRLSVLKMKGVKTIALVHDINSLRMCVITNQKLLKMQDKKLLSGFDAVICHNEKMGAKLAEMGIDRKKTVPLEIFDYYTNGEITKERKFDGSVVYAGNLKPLKSGFVNKVIENGIISNFHLYGPGFSPDLCYEKYHGVVDAGDLPACIEGSFGLVWDGNEIDSCGELGEYIKIINPHKCSLYLASNMPVIVWKESAMADFVRKNECGIVIETLSEADEKIRCLTETQYQAMKRNAERIGERLRSGYYTRKAVKTAMMKLDEAETVK